LVHEVLYRDRARYPTPTALARDWRRLAPTPLLLGAIGVAYVAYRALILPPWTAEGRQTAELTPWLYFVSEWPAILHYVRLFLWPDALSIDPSFPLARTVLDPRVGGALLVLVAWVVVALLASERFPPVAFGSAWFLITLVPESSLAPLAQLANDPRPSLASSLGLSVLLAWLVQQGARRLPSRLESAGIVGACLLLCLPAVAFDRYRTWQWADALRIWEDAIRKNPRN